MEVLKALPEFFYDSSRTLKMQVDLNASIQNNYYFFEVLNPNAKQVRMII